MLCLTLIARNESRCLARCLQSAGPHVDEMLVVDTGSSDDTREIARRCGARVAEFPWCDDFSAARNFALEQAPASWHLVLDADEWICGGGESLRAAVAGDAQPFIGLLRVRSAFDDGQALRHAQTWVARLLPAGVRYEGRVHEQPVSGLPRRRLEVAIEHDGYRKAQRHAKEERNERLLRLSLAQAPDDAFLHYQLGKDLEVREQFAAAAGEYALARNLVGWPPASGDRAAALRERHPWLHDQAARNLFCLKRERRFEEALALMAAESAWWNDSPDYPFACGDLKLDLALAEPARAAELLPQMRAHWMRCLELGEAPQLEGAVEGRGSFLAAHNLALLNDLLGHADLAAHFRRLAARR
jgi:hypothetical protein